MLICKGLHLKGLPFVTRVLLHLLLCLQGSQGIRGCGSRPARSASQVEEEPCPNRRASASFLHPAPQPSQWHQPRPLQARDPGLGDAGESRLRLREPKEEYSHEHADQYAPPWPQPPRVEPHGGGEHRHRETRHRSRDPDREQDHTSATGSGAATNPRITTVTRMGKGVPQTERGCGLEQGAYIRQWLFCPFVLFFFLSLVYPPPAQIHLGGKGVYIAIICGLSCIFCTAAADASNSMK